MNTPDLSGTLCLGCYLLDSDMAYDLAVRQVAWNVAATNTGALVWIEKGCYVAYVYAKMA